MGELLSTGGGNTNENSIAQDASSTVDVVAARNGGLKGTKIISYSICFSLRVNNRCRRYIQRLLDFILRGYGQSIAKLFESLELVEAAVPGVEDLVELN